MLPFRPVQPRAPRVRAVAALVSAGVLATVLLGGCSGPFGANDSGSGEPTSESSAVVVAPDAVVPESDGGGAEMPAAEPNATPEADCAALQAAWNQTNQALVNLSADHPRALVNSFRVAAEAMTGVEAPEAIAEPWSAMARYLARVNKGLEDVDASDAGAVSAAMADAVSADDTKAATAAGEKITQFVSGGCVAP
ncbi:hypothetical protein [Xylanimonas allomyrinae]|uniref:hypothetical protein n=1 Tax=Xylanimonas allomyrinae TaxID=2509459 RepID=UPI001B86B4E0|nr:hypothetical protein [Xylanimonas allomyrinae]